MLNIISLVLSRSVSYSVLHCGSVADQPSMLFTSYATLTHFAFGLAYLLTAPLPYCHTYGFFVKCKIQHISASHHHHIVCNSNR